MKATYQDHISAGLQARLSIPVQADDFEAGGMTSCVRLERATTGLGFVATFLPSSHVSGTAFAWGCEVQLPGRYLVVQLKEEGQNGRPPGGGQPGGGQGPITLPPAQRIEQLFSQALKLGKDIVPPEFTEVFSFIAMVSARAFALRKLCPLSSGRWFLPQQGRVQRHSTTVFLTAFSSIAMVSARTLRPDGSSIANSGCKDIMP